MQRRGERNAELAADPRTNEELIQLILDAGEDEERVFDELLVLLARGTRDTFIDAKALLENGSIAERCLGAKILGELGLHAPWLDESEANEKSFFQERLALLHERLEEEIEVNVQVAIIYALGHMNDRRNAAPLLLWSAHTSADIREAVAYALAGINTPEVIAALITLSRDVVDEVRDWAVFSLAGVSDEEGNYIDNGIIRDAFAACLDDASEDVRSGALAGLARRGDPRVITPLLRELEREDFPVLVKDAAIDAGIQIGDSRLLPYLLTFRDYSMKLHKLFCSDMPLGEEFPQEIDQAINRCLADKENG